MIDADEFIDDFLQHKTEYDAAEAHDYYMRTRKLKGRKKAAASVAAKPHAPAGLSSNQLAKAKKFESLTTKFSASWAAHERELDQAFTKLDKNPKAKSEDYYNIEKAINKKHKNLLNAVVKISKIYDKDKQVYDKYFHMQATMQELKQKAHLTAKVRAKNKSLITNRAGA